MSTKLTIFHFNDVYRVMPQKISPISTETIDVTQFAQMLNDLRETYSNNESITLFSGDLFSPSVESSVTRGSHMVPVINELAPDVSLTGNHDFDFGYPHLSKLIGDTKFPWLLSNVVSTETFAVPDCLHEYYVLERAGLRIGVIGLIEKEWIGTISSWPQNFQYKDGAEVALDLSKRLRDPDGQHCCDVIVALTHARVPNDIALAKRLRALSPAAQEKEDISSTHGVDLLLGGHDHLYYISGGVSSWDGYDTSQEVLGAEDDHGDILVIKSGTDFRDLSEITLELSDTPKGSVRRKVIKTITGKRHATPPGSNGSQKLAKILEKLLSSVSDSMKAPVCKSSVQLDLRSQLIRTAESAAGNWFADVVKHSYDDALCMKGCGGSDGVFVCAGTLRGDSMYGPGDITLGDILEILPFDDPVVVLELDGETIWAALEASLSTWPAQEGRFPVISGFRVQWDSSRKPGERVLQVHLTKELAQTIQQADLLDRPPESVLVDGPAVPREKGGRKYKIVTREYMAQGFDGFSPLQNQRYLIDDENGQLYSSLVRKYLMGCHYVNTMSHLSQDPIQHMHPETNRVISRENAKWKYGENSHIRAASRWRVAAAHALQHMRSKAHYVDNINVAGREDMSPVDCYDGAKARRQDWSADKNRPHPIVMEAELPVISPNVDGRLKDNARDRS